MKSHQKAKRELVEQQRRYERLLQPMIDGRKEAMAMAEARRGDEVSREEVAAATELLDEIKRKALESRRRSNKDQQDNDGDDNEDGAGDGSESVEETSEEDSSSEDAMEGDQQHSDFDEAADNLIKACNLDPRSK